MRNVFTKYNNVSVFETHDITHVTGRPSDTSGYGLVGLNKKRATTDGQRLLFDVNFHGRLLSFLSFCSSLLLINSIQILAFGIE